jgi:A/G-specific adenine glycosylase
MSISSTLINWYLEKKRDLPWRNSSNPYFIWVSEVILQQTRIAQGIDYYNRFIIQFPDILSLANADINEVLKVWQGLGYYTRARNMHAGAKYIVQQLHGILPNDYTNLIKIKGIGEYTAAAIGSIAFNLPLAAVDGNVNRVIARVFGVRKAINSSEGIKQIKEIAQSILDKKNPGLHNQAVMEFGALQCTIRTPNCNICPLFNECYAKLHDQVELLPIKIKQQKIRNRYFNYMVLLYKDSIILSKRSQKDIWEGLYEFPLVETSQLVNEKQLTKNNEWKALLKNTGYQLAQISKMYSHQLTHQKINALFYVIFLKNKPENLNTNHLVVKTKDIHQFPVSRLIENYLSTLDFRNY